MSASRLLELTKRRRESGRELTGLNLQFLALVAYVKRIEAESEQGRGTALR